MRGGSEEPTPLPGWLRVDVADSQERTRAVNALVVLYGVAVVGAVATLPLVLVAGGVVAGLTCVAVTLTAVISALLVRSGRLSAGLGLFFAVVMVGNIVAVMLTDDARLTAVYCVIPVAIAGVTLTMRWALVVTGTAALIGVVGTWMFPPGQGGSPPITRDEIITTSLILMAAVLVTTSLGSWGQKREGLRADLEAHRATELAQSLRSANAELERRVEERTEELQRALSQQERLVGELAELTMRDPLTGLHNRRHAEHELPRMTATAQRYDQPLAMALLDLDHFKQVNDRHSYAVGDEVLMRFTAILRENARASDVVVRYGGEEFLLVMPQTTLPQALVLCERLRAAVEAYAWRDVHPDLRLTVSIGVADSDQRDLRGVTAAMDAALHDAKRDGRNRVVAAPAALPRRPVQGSAAPGLVELDATAAEQPAES
ncbi:GGDEF domain-containing protein [Longivirga aurantiaca]|uniref:Diguanylate cyclase n=1 Tax=Longivirga aurantiaca TaxID=1837743 RepID=A0ABW1T3D1_9ACTN